MATFHQMQRLIGLEHDGWFAVGVPEHAVDLREQPIGGPATVINAAGDVAKVYGDGRVVGYRAQAWAHGGPSEEFYPALPDDQGAV